MYTTGRAIRRKNASPPVGYAKRLDIGIRTVQRKNKKEEEVKAVEEVETSQILDREASQRREETHHIQRKEMVKNQTGITEQEMFSVLMIHSATLRSILWQGLDPVNCSKMWGKWEVC